MAGNVQAVGGIPQVGVQPNICSKLYEFTEVIAQLAVKILFVTGSILITAAALPITWHAIVIPFVAIGTTALAGFFYPLPDLIRGPLFGPVGPLVRPVQVLANGELPADFPADAPRGFRNASQNCAFNSKAQFFDVNPQLAQWMRNPLADDIGMAAFRNVILGYSPLPNLPDAQGQLRDPQGNVVNPPEGLVNPINTLLDQFEIYFNALPAPPPNIPTAFSAFLQVHVPPLAHGNAVNALRATYQNLRIALGAYNQFYQANDAAVQARQAIARGNSQNLRVALSQVSAVVDPSQHHQMDVAEVMDPFFSILPNNFKTTIETTYHYNMDGLPAMLEQRIPKRELTGFFSLPIKGDDLSLGGLFRNYCNGNNNEYEPQRYWGVDRLQHEYPVARAEVNILEPPPALCFQIKRFTIEIPPVSWYNRLLPSLFPPLRARGVKLDNPIEFPDEYSVTLKNGQVCRYRLASFINHHGAYGGGHYTSGKIVNGNKYLISDESVTLVTPALQEAWNERLKHAYFAYYLPVPDPVAAPAPVPVPP